MVCRWKIQICISPSVQGRTTLPDVLNLVQPPVDTVFFSTQPFTGTPCLLRCLSRASSAGTTVFFASGAIHPLRLGSARRPGLSPRVGGVGEAVAPRGRRALRRCLAQLQLGVLGAAGSGAGDLEDHRSGRSKTPRTRFRAFPSLFWLLRSCCGKVI